jgi:hypothetical protein
MMPVTYPMDGGPMDGRERSAVLGDATHHRIAFSGVFADVEHGTPVHVYQFSPVLGAWEYEGIEPWDGITTLHDLTRLLRNAGAADVGEGAE